jgi:hypothetical protein
MPEQIPLSDFVNDTWDDFKSPTTSSFTKNMPNYKNLVSNLEEVSKHLIPFTLHWTYFNWGFVSWRLGTVCQPSKLFVYYFSEICWCIKSSYFWRTENAHFCLLAFTVFLCHNAHTGVYSAVWLVISSCIFLRIFTERKRDVNVSNLWILRVVNKINNHYQCNFCSEM